MTIVKGNQKSVDSLLQGNDIITTDEGVCSYGSEPGMGLVCPVAEFDK